MTTVIKDTVLIDFIVDNHTPQRAKLILEAIEGLLSYNMLDIIPDLETVILNDDFDTTMRIEGVKAVLIEGIKETLNFLGIIPYQLIIDFPEISKVIIAIDKCMNDYSPDYILDNTLIDADDESDLTKVHSITYLLESQPEVKFYDVIHSISDTMIPEMSKILNSKVVPELSCDDPIILKRYLEFTKGRATGIIYEYIANGGGIGTMESNTFMEMITEPMLKVPPPDRPYEIISAILISTIEKSEIKEELGKWASYFTDNDSELAFIEKELDIQYNA